MKNRALLIQRLIVGTAVLLLAAAFVFSQDANKNPGQSEAGPIRSSPAYSEILLRRTELQADLEAFAVDYTEANPKIADLRFEINALDKELGKVFAVRPTETAKLTLALGKLIIRKAGLETDLNRLSRSYNKEHPEVKRMKRKVEIFDAAISEILGK